MDWIQISIYTAPEGIEPVSGRLYQLGINGVEIEDETDFKTFLEENKDYWDYVDDELIKQKSGETRIKTYVSDNLAGREMLASISDSLRELKELDDENQFGRLELVLDNVKEEDWANNWKKYYHPIEIGSRILIRPEWEDVPSNSERTVFTINPGMSFGTGSHDTTRLCLESLEKLVVPGCSMLDLGCGSGILSIVSILLGAAKAHAVDIDPNAVDIAYENASKNGVGKNVYTVEAGNIVSDSKLRDKLAENKYDIVAANIVADVIIAVAPFIPNFMTKDGVFITSGIITDRLEDVKASLEDVGFRIDEINISGDWASVICRL